MIEYKVLADDPQKGLVVQGNFVPGSIPVNIPHDNPKRNPYISLFLIYEILRQVSIIFNAFL